MGVIGEASFLQEREPMQFSKSLLGQTENARLVLHADCTGIPNERQGDSKSRRPFLGKPASPVMSFFLCKPTAGEELCHVR